MHDGLEYLGADDLDYVGFDYGALFQAAGGLVQGGVNIYEQNQAEGKATKEGASKLDAAIAADRDAANAAAKADVSAQLKSKTAKADVDAAAKAVAKADSAGADLSPDGSAARAAAAEKMLATMQKNAKAKPKDGYQAALLKAWTATVDRIHGNVAADAGGKGKHDENQESWLQSRVLGPVPGYGVLVGGFALVGVLVLLLKRR